MRAILGNVRGNAMLGALAAVTMAGVVGTAAISYNNAYLKQSHVNYLRAVMSSVESNVSSMAMQPYAYDCSSGPCDISSTFFDGVLKTPVPSADCPGSTTGCGVSVKNMAIVPNGAGKMFAADIVYEGQETQLRDIEIRMPIPTDVLQPQDVICPAFKPIFGGFNADGTPRCFAFNDCPNGFYVSDIDFDKTQLICKDLGAQSTKLSCTGSSPQPMITAINWNNGDVTRSCDQVPIPPPPTTITKPVVTTPTKPTPTCNMVTWNDNQPMATNYQQNSTTALTVDFAEGMKQMPAGCKLDHLHIELKRAGVSPFGGCNWLHGYASVVPGGGTYSMGFINGGGSGSKTMYGTVTVEGTIARFTEHSNGWGNAAGNSTAACISNVVVMIHSVPQ